MLPLAGADSLKRHALVMVRCDMTCVASWVPLDGAHGKATVSCCHSMASCGLWSALLRPIHRSAQRKEEIPTFLCGGVAETTVRAGLLWRRRRPHLQGTHWGAHLLWRVLMATWASLQCRQRPPRSARRASNSAPTPPVSRGDKMRADDLTCVEGLSIIIKHFLPSRRYHLVCRDPWCPFKCRA